MICEGLHRFETAAVVDLDRTDVVSAVKAALNTAEYLSVSAYISGSIRDISKATIICAVIGLVVGANYYFESGAYMWAVIGGIVGAIIGIALVR